MYLYQVLTPWYEEFLDLLDELDEFEEPESFGDEDDNPLGSYYSQN
jgi:hypothetical protein